MAIGRWSVWQSAMAWGCLTLGLIVACEAGLSKASTAAELRIGVFSVDASPPVGSPLAYDPTKEITDPLSCSGVVIVGSGRPIVLCAVDWIGIGNRAHLEFRRQLAKAAGTDPQRVAVHTLHQHDAPRCDFDTDDLLKEHGIAAQFFDVPFAQRVMARASAAVSTAVEKAQSVTHLGLGQAAVEKVASNRRILGADGKVAHIRWTASKDPKIRAFPAGTIDPALKMISFWNRDTPLVALTYYATHPQSYYRTGGATPDFPGLARNARQSSSGVPHVHFNGAGGNIGAGKWNDGSHEKRQVLTDRMADGMRRAWKATQRTPLESGQVAWQSTAVKLPPAPHLDEKLLASELANTKLDSTARFAAANNLAWLRRCRQGGTVDIGCLRVGKARVLHMPGELFVEYQLAAQKQRSDLFVAMAAYGDYAPGYIGTRIAYSQGGYETSARASQVAPAVEDVLSKAVNSLLAK